MNMKSHPTAASHGPHTVIRRLVALGVAAHGLFMIGSTLAEQLSVHGVRHLHVGSLVAAVPLLLGLSLLYLSTLLARGKRTAWAVALAVYGAVLGFGAFRLGFFALHHHGAVLPLVLTRDSFLPLILVAGLYLSRRDFTVKSDLRSFRVALRFVVIVMLVAFLYGVSGFLLLDKRDFHQEITAAEAVHRTIDQFDLTTSHALVPYTRRAKLFQDSLSVVSIGALAYAGLSLFQPLRARFRDQSASRELARRILERYHGSSEDFFKLWPHDKAYFFSAQRTAGLAYGVHRGVALVVGDPFGDREHFDGLLADFADFCRTNDWAVAFIHTEPRHSELYKRHGFSLQKIGEEAVVDIAHFQKQVRGNKYFRQIANRFEKQGFTTEILEPPHDAGTLQRAAEISRAWLSQPGRAERRFMMGYFSPAYMQQGPFVALRDAEGSAVAFLNQVHSFDQQEANFDLLRHTKTSLGNSNDMLLMAFIAHAEKQGFRRVNLGLCPLAGLDHHEADRSVIDSALRFLYANGDRFYSFSGLKRFKAKYEPEWSARYIAYRGGIRGFTRVLNALNKAMKV